MSVDVSRILHQPILGSRTLHWDDESACQATAQALATLVTHRGDPFKKGDLDNGIDCHHESKNGSRVERVTWTAKVFNPAGQHATLPRFKEICLDYAARLGCALPKGLFVKVDPEKGQRMETADAVFEIDKLRFDEGYAWRFRITSK